MRGRLPRAAVVFRTSRKKQGKKRKRSSKPNLNRKENLLSSPLSHISLSPLPPASRASSAWHEPASKNQRVQVPQACTTHWKRHGRFHPGTGPEPTPLRHMRGRKWAQPRDTEPGQLSVSSYNGVLGEQQTLLKPEGGKGRGKKISPAGQLRMRSPVFGDSILCSALPRKVQ